MNVLVLGSGGREHAIAWKINQSKLISKLYCAPGNAGTKQLAKNIPLPVDDFENIASFSLKNNIELIVVGPELPLVKGIKNYFLNNKKFKHIKVIGPDKKAALLEGSKCFAKKFMNKYNIPTAKYKSFNEKNINHAKDFLSKLNPPYVLKADGLAAGKGVIITNNEKQAINEIYLMIKENKFGEAGKTIVIEEFLDGVEMSVFILTDGNNYILLPDAKDYKRIGDNNTGANTGGMGAISPVPFTNAELIQKIKNKIIENTLLGLKNEGINYSGFIYFGLMIVNNEPFLLEYNIRLGDPETQVILPRLSTDFLDLLIATEEGNLNEKKIQISKNYACTVIAASKGYPHNYEKNKIITGIENVNDSILFYAGVKEENNKYFTNGGRVLAITSLSKKLEQAIRKSYNSMEKINFENKYFRTDIGKDLIPVNS